MARPSPTMIAFLVACLGIALFSVMDTLMKGLVIALGVYNALFWRSLMGAAASGLLFTTTGTAWPAVRIIRLHLQRGVIVAGMTLLWFWSLEFLPLAEAIALSFISPLIALYLAAVLLKERIGKAAIIASALGLAGVVVMMGARIGAAELDVDGLWGAGAIFGSGRPSMPTTSSWHAGRRCSPRPPEIALFMNGIMAIIFGLAAPWWAIVPDAGYWPAILAGAGLALVSLLLLSWAYARAEAQILIPVEYTGFIWLALLGWAVFDEVLTWPVIIGTALIVTGSAIAARASAQSATPTPAAPVA